MTLTTDLEVKVRFAAALVGMTPAEYVCSCVMAGLTTHANHDALLAAAFRHDGSKLVGA